MTTYLSLEDLLFLCEEIGGLCVRDRGLLDAAAHRPASALFGDDAYPDLHTKAAVLLESIAGNPPSVDGNNRLGWLATVVFYGLNGVELDAPEDPAYDLVIDVATGSLSYDDVARRLAEWTRPVSG
ncbi:type II toxin-antitoxin system death-on-curing family toxin [Georgenia sunbinii]|uniref:type II toxin-antitoxin system death-on-curing family toxin n=1 Tax=Georgenia sunbinii TaxID=3117728 RepID=UPI002F26BBF2